MKQQANRGSQNVEAETRLHKVLESYIPEKDRLSLNRTKGWKRGYNREYDMVVISMDGTVGEVYEIQGLRIALPQAPEDIVSRSVEPLEQYWERKELPPVLDKIKSIFHWNEKSKEFRARWTPYINTEFDRREDGYWFMNKGVPTYITGSHYMYIQWASIDVGYPDFRESNRLFEIFWEGCKADSRSYGMCYLKNRRSGFSFMSSSECVNVGTVTAKARIGVLSKTGHDAKTMFTGKVVPINSKLPFFFKPIMDGMDKPKTELAYRVPAEKMTKKKMNSLEEEDIIEGLDTSIDWRNTDDNAYDGEKLKLLIHDESGKWLKPNNIKNNWKVVKTCLRLGRKIIGKCMMGSTCNAKNKGGKEFKEMYEDSNVNIRSANQQTKSGLYALFIPMEWNMEGFIDRWGFPVQLTPDEPVLGCDGEMITQGAIEYWKAEVEALKDDPDALNEYYRQFPRTEAHAFRDESKQSIFNLTKIYEQIDHNDGMMMKHHVTRGSFKWKDGKKDTIVIFEPDPRGRFKVSWLPPAHLQNRVGRDHLNRLTPLNRHIGAFGCDSYDISGVVGGQGSKGALHGLTKFHMEDAPTNEFFLEYVARPRTAEIFFEEVLMACVFYGMPILAENNKPRLLYHFKERGYRQFSINRPDKPKARLSVTEKELGGIPNTSEDVKQSHAAAIENYIEKYVGIDMTGAYRDAGTLGYMPFNRTLEDWAGFEFDNRTKYDASISSGLAIMACMTTQKRKLNGDSKIKVNFTRYNNRGNHSRKVR